VKKIAIALIAVVCISVLLSLLDIDGDGLRNIDELWAGTNLLDPDTDGDGLNDGVEVHIYKTSPKNSDTDADGLTDHEEVHTYATDPLSADSDGDRVNDFDECKIHLTNPRNPDTDYDGLSDGEEIQTYKTNPLAPDTDEDGLKDGWEVKGYDADGDGIIDVNLPAWGANPLKKDIFVEVDWMPGHSLSSDAKNRLIAAFANAPVSNPDGSTGIKLHIDDGAMGGGTVTEYAKVVYAESSFGAPIHTEGAMNDYLEFKDKYFTSTRKGIFHWALIARRVSTGEPGKEKYVGGVAVHAHFIVAGEGFTPFQVGQNFMHELGHALGLLPSKFDGIDSYKYDPETYPSVMNYNFQEQSILYEIFVGESDYFYRYSSGPPFNDWANLDLAYYLERERAR